MTQSQLDAIFADLQFMSYMPFEMKWQGNPLLLAGDKVTITDINNQIYTTLVMDQQLKYTGGLSSNISAKGQSEAAQDFDFKGSLTEKVERIEKHQAERDPNTTPQQPSSITATGLFENILVEWTFENANFINSYEVYASQINNFVPNESNLVWRGKSGAFNYYANVNETWYFRVRGVNSHGVAGPFSAQASATTAQVLSTDILFDENVAESLKTLSQTAQLIADGTVTFDILSNDVSSAITTLQTDIIQAQTDINSAQSILDDALDDLDQLEIDLSDKISIGNAAQDINTHNTQILGKNLIVDGDTLVTGTISAPNATFLELTTRDMTTINAIIQDSTVTGTLTASGSVIQSGTFNDITANNATIVDATITGELQAVTGTFNGIVAGEGTVGTLAIADGAIKRAHLQEAIIENAHIADGTIEMAKIKSLNADDIISGTIQAIDIVGSSIVSFNTANNNVVTLQDGEVLTYVDGKQRFGMHGNGLVAYHWLTEQEIASFRATHINNESFGAGIVGYGDYFTIGKHLSGSERTQLGFYWDGAYDKTRLYGGSGSRDNGYLLLQSTVRGGTAEGRVPHLIIDNRTTDGTSYSGARFYVGRDNRSPSSANFSSGFEVWQFTGNGNGGLHRFMDMDTNTSGTKYVNFWVDNLFVDGGIDTNGGITTSGASNFYGHLNMRDYNITNVADLQVSRLRAGGSSGRYLDFYNGYLTTNAATYDGLFLTRVNGDGGVFFHGDRSALVGGSAGKYAVFTVGSDSRSDLVQSTTIRDRTYTSSANVFVTENGVLGQTSSSRKDKLLIEPMKVDHYNILDITPSDWFDKPGTEAYANYLDNEKTLNLDEEDVPYLRRIPGAVAEDFESVGLGIYVHYDKDGNVQGLMYDRAWLSLVPIVKDHEIKLTAHEQEIIALKDKVSVLENEIESLKGVS